MSFSYLLSPNEYNIYAKTITTSSITHPGDTDGQITEIGDLWARSETSSTEVRLRSSVILKYRVINGLMYIRMNSSTGGFTIANNPDADGWTEFYWSFWNVGEPLNFSIPYLCSSEDRIFETVIAATYSNVPISLSLRIDSQWISTDGSWRFIFKPLAPITLLNEGLLLDINNFSVVVPVVPITN